MGRAFLHSLYALGHRGLKMWKCEDCGSVFSEPDSIRYCIDEYNGTAGLFGNWQYGYYEACPYCQGEDIIRIYEEEDEWID